MKVYIVKEDYRLMNHSCDIGSEIHLVTEDFEKAHEKALVVKSYAKSEFSHVQYEENEIVNLNKEEYAYLLQNGSDLVEVSIEIHEVA